VSASDAGWPEFDGKHISQPSGGKDGPGRETISGPGGSNACESWKMEEYQKRRKGPLKNRAE
jgi:hypothetical protein